MDILALTYTYLSIAFPVTDFSLANVLVALVMYTHQMTNQKGV